MEWLKLAVVIVFAYLCGAIPVGLLIGLRQGIDLRTRGSGKTGATNTMRVLGRGPGIAVALLDAAKGLVPVLLARLLAPDDDTWLAAYMGVAATAAIAGHSWSIIIKLMTGKWGGGRGVATSIGAMFGIYPPVGLVALLILLAVIYFSRYVSLGSIIGISAGSLITIVLIFMGQIPFWFFPWAIVIAAMVVLLHHDNIDRLLKGTERKVGQRA